MRTVALLALSLVSLACHESRTSSAPPPAQPAPTMAPAHEGHGMAERCPMNVPGSQVSTQETSDGIAIVFTTPGNVAKLRERVHHMAEMHQDTMEHHGHGHMMTMVPSQARVEDIEGGARIVLTPNDPSQIAELRDRVHAHVDQMSKDGGCPMMHGAA